MGEDTMTQLMEDLKNVEAQQQNVQKVEKDKPVANPAPKKTIVPRSSPKDKKKADKKKKEISKKNPYCRKSGPQPSSWKNQKSWGKSGSTKKHVTGQHTYAKPGQQEGQYQRPERSAVQRKKPAGQNNNYTATDVAYGVDDAYWVTSITRGLFDRRRRLVTLERLMEKIKE